MKYNAMQKILLCLAVTSFAGFLVCLMRDLGGFELAFVTCMGISFLMILLVGSLRFGEEGEDRMALEGAEESEAATPHVDNLIDQLADRREENESMKKDLLNTKDELERTNELLNESNKEKEELASKVQALNDQLDRLKGDLGAAEAARDQAVSSAKETLYSETILPSAGEIEQQIIPIAEAAKTAVDAFSEEAKKAGVALRIVSPEEPLMVKADPRMIDILFKNIIDNALKYMSKSGTLQVTISKIEDELFIVMKDNGNGLSESETEHIFELNYQGSNRISGNGLGLAQARAIVQYYGGMIYARSGKGRGMGIYIHLPSSK